jgi:pyruvate dehydrogenase E1 component alpha subunit
MATTQGSGKKRRGSVAGAPGPNGSAPGSTVQVEPSVLLKHYREMVLIRIFEEACLRGFRTGKIGGYLHVYIGQEAVALGFLDAFSHEKGDRVITAYRDHAHALILGSTPNEVMAELYGKGTGLVKGKGGSMHLFDAENGFLGGYGIVGGHIPLGVGLAYAMRYQGADSVVQLYLGDGAIHNGAFHEAANLAGLWGRDGLNPILFILENNQYGMGTSVQRATAQTDLGKKFESYAVPYEKVDGMDLEAVITAAHRAVDQMRETGQPYAIEAMTYRLAPHGAADFLERYRSKDEVKEARQRDPIGLLEHKLLERDIASEDDLEKIRAEAKQITDEAVRFAEESPEPALDELMTDVYSE